MNVRMVRVRSSYIHVEDKVVKLGQTGKGSQQAN